METAVAVTLEEGRLGDNTTSNTQNSPNTSRSNRQTTSSRISSFFNRLFPFTTAFSNVNRSRAATQSSRSSGSNSRRHPRPQPINVQKTIEMPIIQMPFHVHRDSFVYKRKKKGQSSLHFVFDSNMSTEQTGCMEIVLFYKNDRIDVANGERKGLKQNLVFKNLPSDTSNIGKALHVIVDDNGFKQITKLELVQSINGFIVARIYSQQVVGKYPDGSHFSHYLQDIYCQPYSISLKNLKNESNPSEMIPENPSEEDDDEDDKRSEINRECIICLSERRDTIVLPCRHMCLCAECAELLSNRADRCPVCREGCQALLQLADIGNKLAATSVG